MKVSDIVDIRFSLPTRLLALNPPQLAPAGPLAYDYYGYMVWPPIAVCAPLRAANED